MIVDTAKDVARPLSPARVGAATSNPRRGRQDLGEVFSSIYANRDRGRQNGGFYSGDGSQDLDERPGRNIRLDAPEAGGSGVVLTAPPFNIRPLHEETLCQVPSLGGVIRTTAYRFGSVQLG
jgi:hypothetical protein